MLLLSALLLLQAPALARSGSEDLPERRRVGLSVSAAGKYLVLIEPDRLDIRDAQTLKPVKELAVKSTAIGFDSEDGRLLVVAENVVRYDTKTWTSQVLGDLPDAQFKKVKFGLDAGMLSPRQAYVTPELDVHYCSQAGVSTAVFEDGKLRVQSMGLNCPEWNRPITGFLDITEAGVLLTLADEKPGVAVKDKVHSLIGCGAPILATTFRGLGVCVARNTEALYSASTWKILQRRAQDDRSEPANLSAAFDRISGWVFVGDPEGLHAWPVEKFGTVVRYHQFMAPVSLIAVSPSSRVLFTLEKNVLRRWTLGD